MVDNVAITAGTGTTMATDDIGGVQYPRVKISQGADGSATDVSSAAPLNVTLANGSVPSHAVTNAGTFAVQNSAATPAGSNLIGKVDVQFAGTVPDTGSGTGGSKTQRVIVDSSQLSALGQTTMSASAPVVIASNQSAVPVAAQAATSGGVSRSRTLIPNNTTAIVVKSGAGQLYKIRATNNSATIAYIKLYDATSATAGSGTPVDTIMIPASTSGAGIVDTTDLGVVHSTGITYIVTTGIADSDTTAPAASTYVVTMYYK